MAPSQPVATSEGLPSHGRQLFPMAACRFPRVKHPASCAQSLALSATSLSQLFCTEMPNFGLLLVSGESIPAPRAPGCLQGNKGESMTTWHWDVENWVEYSSLTRANREQHICPLTQDAHGSCGLLLLLTRIFKLQFL